MKRSILVLTFILVAAGCSREPSIAVQVAKTPLADAKTASAPATNVAPAPQQPQLVTVSGRVLETLGASDYTYMRLKTEGGEIWAAVTRASVKKGQDVTVVNAMPMDGWESKTLNRKFDRIVFGTLGEPGGAAPAASAHAAAPIAPAHENADLAKAREAMMAQHASAAAGPADVGKIDVKKAAGPDGRTVAEIFAGKDALKGKEVAVRGKVVKYTPGVMGKNWVHLRDGSGSREKKNDDLTVATAETTALGEVILVKGVVRLDVDLGAGYAYPVLIENAKLSK